MVARSDRNTLRGHWRHNPKQCRASYYSWSRFHRAIIRRLGLSRWTGAGYTNLSRSLPKYRISALLTPAIIAIIIGTTLPVWASANTHDDVTTVQSPVSYQDALNAYEDGNKTLALIQAKLAGSQGDADAQVMAGHILLRGETGLIDERDAVTWFRLAATQNHPDALVALGEMALRGQAGLSQSDALGWLTKAAGLGRADAMRVLADMYTKGHGVAPDITKAAEWLRRSTQQGDTRSPRRMGDLYFESNPSEALKWYEKAAAAGDHEAAYLAAVMYAENFEIRPDSQKSASLMRQAAEGGIAAAQADYGLLVYQGAGVDRSIDTAAYWFEKSAKNGDKEGQFLYAFTLAKGEGVSQNFEEAYYWLLKSGTSGIDDYDKDRKALRERLEANVDPAILDTARRRAAKNKNTAE